jgi:hypothetical protein
VSDYDYMTPEESLQAAFEADPMSTAAVIAQQAAVNAATMTSQHYEAKLAQHEGVQAEIAGAHVDSSLTGRFGDWPQYRQAVVEFVGQNPNYLTNTTSPAQIEADLANVYRVVKGQHQEAEPQRAWERIENSGRPNYGSLRGNPSRWLKGE